LIGISKIFAEEFTYFMKKNPIRQQKGIKNKPIISLSERTGQ